MSETIKNRYEFILYFDVENGNPNGDPDAGNMPRIDAQTGYGIVSDVCLKRKVRNYVELVRGGKQGYDIYVTEGAVLNNKQREAYEELGIEAARDTREETLLAQKYMCRRFFDIRTFGAVMSTGGYKCGQVRGPAQLCFSKSVSPIYQQEITITRMASTTEQERATENRTMGRKYIVPYGLYRLEGFISTKLAEKTGFTEDDLNLFFDALKNMFEHDRSAARGKMTSRRLFVFKHESALGSAPASVLFETVTTEIIEPSKPPRAFSDYRINAPGDEDGILGVKLLKLL
jgi:CRISPR-associated protein Csd2